MNDLAPLPPAQPSPLQQHTAQRLDVLMELRMLVQRAEQQLRLYEITDLVHECMEDHRTGLVADLLDVMDRVEPGLGTRLMYAMYPRSRPNAGVERRMR